MVDPYDFDPTQEDHVFLPVPDDILEAFTLGVTTAEYAEAFADWYVVRDAWKEQPFEGCILLCWGAKVVFLHDKAHGAFVAYNTLDDAYQKYFREQFPDGVIVSTDTVRTLREKGFLAATMERLGIENDVS